MPSPPDHPPQSGWLIPASAYGLLCAFFAIAAAMLVRKHPVEPLPAIAIYACFVLYLGAAMVPAFPASCAWARRRIEASGAARIVIPTFIAPYLIYVCTGDFRWASFLKLAALIVVPVVLYVAFPVKHPGRMNWQDAAVWLWWMLPTVLRLTTGIWLVPVNLDFMTRLVILGAASWSWLLVRPVPNVGYRLSLTPRAAWAAASNTALFAFAAIPIGLATGFMQYNPRWKGVWPFSFDFITILLFIAVLEELFFRGILQNLLSVTIGMTRAHLWSSLIFGLSHILFAPAPNWRYVAMASVAGWFYGRAYSQTGGLAAPCLAHALVDTIWRTWFGRGAGSVLG